MRELQRSLLACLLCFPPSAVRLAGAEAALAPHFEIGLHGLTAEPKEGRLFVVISSTNNPEPRLLLGNAGAEAPVALARDVNAFTPGKKAVLDEHAFIFPPTNLAAWLTRTDRALPTQCFAQALFVCNADLRSISAAGNLFSSMQEIRLPLPASGTVRFDLDHEIPPEKLPPETDRIKFVKIQSKLLSQFHGRPIFLRAGIILPRDYEREPSRRYALWVRIGGLNERYTAVTRLMARDSGLRKIWEADDTPRLVLVQLDGAGPYGDPYQVNSANSGPYGDAVTQELIPYVETKFRAICEPRARVLSGTSTGGWVALALQIFYPDFFDGAWSSCPDPVDFRAFELVNIYEDDNAFVDTHGGERPSERDLLGNVILTMRQEVGTENLLGRGNSYTLSGEQWGAWNATFGPRGADGLPVPLWDPQTGRMNHSVAEQWKKYDLRLVLEQNWKTLGPKLRGKLHIASGEADQYFLNNAAHLLDEFLAHADPPFEGKIVFGPGQGHGWYNLTPREVMQEMKAATE
jgi:S-formylglutathione hydrolase FrmB